MFSWPVGKDKKPKPPSEREESFLELQQSYFKAVADKEKLLINEITRLLKENNTLRNRNAELELLESTFDERGRQLEELTGQNESLVREIEFVDNRYKELHKRIEDESGEPDGDHERG